MKNTRKNFCNEFYNKIKLILSIVYQKFFRVCVDSSHSHFF